MLKIDEFKDKLFKLAKEEGFEEYEIHYTTGKDFEVNVYKREIDNYAVNSTVRLSFKGLYGGKMGYAYTEILDDDAAIFLVNKAKENAKIIENEDKEFIYEGDKSYGEVASYNEELNSIKAEDKINLAFEMEDLSYKKSDKVINTEYCVVETSEGSLRIINSKGLDLSFKSNVAIADVIPVVSDGKKSNTACAYKCTNDFKAISARSLVNEACDEALSYIGAESMPSAKYHVAIRNDVAASILSTFSGVFSAYNVQKGLSLLKGKLKQKIASDIVTIVDDPLLKGGLSSAPFDDEGVATYKKDVVKDGILVTYLHNLKTAFKDGVKSTGNAVTGGVAPSNFFIKPGEKGFEAVLKDLGEGLLITDVQGLHAGANFVTGDFSIAAKGFIVKCGKIDRPVEQITVAGNFFKMLDDIEEVGSDIKFGFPGRSCFGSPTILVKELSVAGK